MIRGLPILAAAAALSACTSISSNYTGAITEIPRERIIVCSGYDCHHRTPVPVGARDAARYQQIMAAGRSSPEAERRAISNAVVHFERRNIEVLGHRDTAKSQFSNFGVLGEMDCIDEATNTQSLMRYLHARGLLRHHTVEPNAQRGFMIDARFVHATAVVREKSGQRWAIDSWERAGGEPPHVMRLEAWLSNGGVTEVIAGKRY